MKRILIPTDFTLESLQLIEYAILNYPDCKLDILLVYGYRMPTTETEAKRHSSSKVINKLAQEAYLNAKKSILLEYNENLNSINFEIFTGVNSFAFQNFIISREITGAIIPNENFLRVDRNKGFDPSPLIKKNIQNTIRVELNSQETKVKRRKFSIFNFLLR